MDDWVSVVCKRGHIVRRIIEVAGLEELGPHCANCGAVVYYRCPECSRPLPIIDVGANVPPFCTGCGLPFPWATREQIVYHVQNQLHRADLSDGDRRALQEQLNELLETPADNDVEKRQVRVLERLREIAPGAWGAVSPIVAPLITAWMRQELRLPPA